jgi:hypothetical protein
MWRELGDADPWWDLSRLQHMYCIPSLLLQDLDSRQFMDPRSDTFVTTPEAGLPDWGSRSYWRLLRQVAILRTEVILAILNARRLTEARGHYKRLWRPDAWLKNEVIMAALEVGRLIESNGHARRLIWRPTACGPWTWWHCGGRLPQWVSSRPLVPVRVPFQDTCVSSENL